MLERRQPYTHARPATGRFIAGIRKASHSDNRIVPPTEPVYRDPCQRCGARGDYDCGHAPVRLGTAF